MVSESLAFSADDTQERILKDAQKAVKNNAYYLRKSTDANDLREALRYSAAMLGELRTSQLLPVKYYELYMQVFDELGNLEGYFADEGGKGKTYAELYELVQHAGNVLPRLYLMVVVGSLYIKSKEVPAKEILKDLVELCKGVQHPTRGLFLRSYLCQKARGLLPDTGNAYEGEGGSIQDSLDFLLSNFIEMNKLWVRMQHQGSTRDREKRERERQQLADLVGKNLTYLSQLDGLDLNLYQTQVLARILEQIVSCKDDIAQQYLMQCVIQGFPDAFHLATLEALLGACPELQPGVKVAAIMASLMDRLAKYATTDPAVMAALLEGKAFDQFKAAIGKVVAAQAEMAAAEAVEMYVALVGFTGAVHPDLVDNVNQVLASCYQTLAARPSGLGTDSRAEKALVTLLSVPLTKYDVVTVLGLDAYPQLMTLLRLTTQKEMAVKIVQTVVDQDTSVSNVDQCEMLFRFIQPLVGNPEEDGSDLDDEDIAEEQVLVARLLHHLRSPDIPMHFSLLVAARNHLLKGGNKRLSVTLPSLSCCTLALVRRMAAAKASGEEEEGGPTGESVMQWLLETCGILADIPQPVMALRLMLAAAVAASEELHLELLAYEFFEQAFMLYEESIDNSRQKIIALQTIISTLHRCHVFSEDNREALVQSATSYASKLLKRSDQCRAVCSCSHLYWQDPVVSAASGGGAGSPVRDSAKVMTCLKRAVKIGNASKQQVAASARAKDASYVALYVEILNHYLYYFDLGVDVFTPSVVQQLVELIKGEVSHMNGQLDPETAAFWANTQSHITSKQTEDGEGRVRYAAIKL